MLLKSDVGLVDARPKSARRARRWVPLSVRYPWSWGTAIVAAMVVPTGVFFGWWTAGLVLVQISGVTLLSFERYLRKGVGRATLIRLCWTLAGVATGVALFLTNGGFGRFRGESEHQRVTSYVEGVTGADVVSAQRVAEQEVGACHYGVWDVRTTRHRWWAVATRGR